MVTTCSLLNTHPSYSESVVNNIQLSQYQSNMNQPQIHNLVQEQSSPFYQNTVSTSVTMRDFGLTSKIDHRLNKAFSTSDLNPDNTLLNSTNDQRKEALTNNLKASIEELRRNNRNLPELQLDISSLPNDENSSEEGEEQATSSSTDDLSEVLNASDTSPVETKNLDDNIKNNNDNFIFTVNEKNDYLSKSEDPFSEISYTSSTHSSKQNEIQGKKELSKEEVKLKMQMRLNEIGFKFKSTPNINLTKFGKQVSEVNSNNIQQNENQIIDRRRPPVPKKPDHLRPQKPKKPSFLVGKSVKEVAGSISRKE